MGRAIGVRWELLITSETLWPTELRRLTLVSIGIDRYFIGIGARSYFPTFALYFRLFLSDSVFYTEYERNGIDVGSRN